MAHRKMAEPHVGSLATISTRPCTEWQTGSAKAGVETAKARDRAAKAKVLRFPVMPLLGIGFLVDQHAG